jgi:hypothetical protein
MSYYSEMITVNGVEGFRSGGNALFFFPSAAVKVNKGTITVSRGSLQNSFRFEDLSTEQKGGALNPIELVEAWANAGRLGLGKVDVGFPATQQVAGAVTVSNLPTTQQVAGSVKRDWSAVGNGAHTNPNVSTASSQVLAANANRNGVMITNTATGTVYLKFGSAATTAIYSAALSAGAYFEVPECAAKSSIHAIKTGATQAIQITTF